MCVYIYIYIYIHSVYRKDSSIFGEILTSIFLLFNKIFTGTNVNSHHSWVTNMIQQPLIKARYVKINSVTYGDDKFEVALFTCQTHGRVYLILLLLVLSVWFVNGLHDVVELFNNFLFLLVQIGNRFKQRTSTIL